RLFPTHRLYGALILLDLHRRVLAIEEDEIKAGVRQQSHVVFIQRSGCADNGLPRLQQISDRIHANKPPTSITCMLDDAPVVAAIVGVVCQRHCTQNASMTKPPPAGALRFRWRSGPKGSAEP